MTTDNENLKERIEREQAFCHCPGYGCSGCEDKIKELIAIGYNVAVDQQKAKNAKAMEILKKVNGQETHIDGAFLLWAEIKKLREALS